MINNAINNREWTGLANLKVAQQKKLSEYQKNGASQIENKDEYEE